MASTTPTADEFVVGYQPGQKKLLGDLRRLFGRTGRSSIPFFITKSIDSLTVNNPFIESTGERYWQTVPNLARRLHRGLYREWDAPLDPFEPIWVDPAEITRVTGREYPAWDYRRLTIGAVRGGDWDRRLPDVPETDLSVEPDVQNAVFFQSFEQRFKNEKPWPETPLYRYLERSERYDAATKIAEYDHLAEQLLSGYQTQCELLEVKELGSNGFYDVVCDEVCVDIGRTGELLFVDGRHRLALAQALELDLIPVIVAVRHKKWMEHRDSVYMGQVKEDHPDLPTGEPE